MTIGLWSSLLVFGGGACLVLGLVHLLAAWRLATQRSQVWLGCLGIVTAVKALAEALLYAAPDPHAYGLTMKWQLAVSFVWGCMLFGYLRAYVGGLEKLCAAAWVAMLAALVVDLAMPHGLVFTQVETLRAARLPWGEVISIGAGPIAGTRWVLDASGLVVAVFFATCCVRAFGTKTRREAWLLSATCVVILLLAFGHGWLVDLGAVDLPYLVTPAVFLFVGIYSVTLADSVVAATQLSRKVVGQERRWHSLVRGVDLMIVSTDPQGRIESVNPEFCRVLGRPEDDLLGSEFLELVPSSDRPAFESSSSASTPFSLESTLDGRGGRRNVIWSSIRLRDDEGNESGRLCLGSDITDQRQAEFARDTAVAEAEELRKKVSEEVLCLTDATPADSVAEEFVGQSDAMQYVRHKIQQVAPTDATVLIQGETGVGKELVGTAIHEASGRRNGRLVVLNCGAVPAALFESELFGHEAGAFTDARVDRVGRFELADGGTLFLDEVGELPLEVQPKLLRALQTGEFERVGSSATRRSDVRVLAATNRELDKEVASGGFRSDLYYRLNVFPLTVPPLRARKDDIHLLLEHFVPLLARRHGVAVDEVPGAVLRELTEYAWPGNVRELINVLERAVIQCSDGTLRLADRLIAGEPPGEEGFQSGRQRLDDVIRGHIESVLQATKGRITGPQGAAEVLGINPSTLRGRMRKLGVQRVR